jgi:small-conductance mechanosensitive channel
MKEFLASAFWHKAYFGNEVLNYFIALGVLIGGCIAVRLFQAIILSAVERITRHTQAHIDDFLVSALKKALIPVLYYAAFYFALRSLNLNPALSKAVTAFGTALLTFAAIRFILQALNYFIFNIWLVKRKDAAELTRQFKALMPILTVLVWALGIVFLLDNLGFKISTLVAGLGIGGVAIALASQTVLADMFSYLAIMLDRPFELDDFIIMGDFLGTVEHIGIKTTRIRSLGGEQLIFSNKDLTDSRIRNYKRMQLRRVVFKFGVVYDTPSDQLQEISKRIKDIITNIQQTRFDRAHFFAFDESQLTFEVVYYVLSADYNISMDIQQEINLAIKNFFEKEKIHFAFPIRILYVNGKNGLPGEQTVPA